MMSWENMVKYRVKSPAIGQILDQISLTWSKPQIVGEWIDIGGMCELTRDRLCDVSTPEGRRECRKEYQKRQVELFRQEIFPIRRS